MPTSSTNMNGQDNPRPQPLPPPPHPGPSPPSMAAAGADHTNHNTSNDGSASGNYSHLNESEPGPPNAAAAARPPNAASFDGSNHDSNIYGVDQAQLIRNLTLICSKNGGEALLSDTQVSQAFGTEGRKKLIPSGRGKAKDAPLYDMYGVLSKSTKELHQRGQKTLLAPGRRLCPAELNLFNALTANLKTATAEQKRRALVNLLLALAQFCYKRDFASSSYEHTAQFVNFLTDSILRPSRPIKHYKQVLKGLGIDGLTIQGCGVQVQDLTDSNRGDVIQAILLQSLIPSEHFKNAVESAWTQIQIRNNVEENVLSQANENMRKYIRANWKLLQDPDAKQVPADTAVAFLTGAIQELPDVDSLATNVLSPVNEYDDLEVQEKHTAQLHTVLRSSEYVTAYESVSEIVTMKLHSQNFLTAQGSLSDDDDTSPPVVVEGLQEDANNISSATRRRGREMEDASKEEGPPTKKRRAVGGLSLAIVTATEHDPSPVVQLMAAATKLKTAYEESEEGLSNESVQGVLAPIISLDWSKVTKSTVATATTTVASSIVESDEDVKPSTMVTAAKGNAVKQGGTTTTTAATVASSIGGSMEVGSAANVNEQSTATSAVASSVVGTDDDATPSGMESPAKGTAMKQDAEVREVFGNVWDGLRLTKAGVKHCLYNAKNWKSKLEELPEMGETNCPPPLNWKEEALCGVKVGPNDFKILKYLGGGANGKVFLAEHSSGLVVAIKYAGFQKRHIPQYLMGELVTGTKVASKNLIRIAGFFAVPDHVISKTEPYTMALIFEACQCNLRSLFTPTFFQDHSDPGVKLRARDATRILLHLFNGVSELHAANITHRDIKPENSAYGTDCIWKVIDYGLARPLDMSLETSKQNLTENCGTLPYVDPSRKGSRTHDCWSLGVMLWELMAGGRPFTNEADSKLKFAANFAAPSDETKEGVREAFDKNNALGEAGNLLVDLVCGLLQPDNKKRLTSAKALEKLVKIDAELDKLLEKESGDD